ncbi:MAG TPA: Ni/Fe hydrogenase subunit alpha [Candidatus Nealsonbacteria bacterium]|uniref:Ni/Fe hydrogenase subunit alpha n=1 Tax=marine sediment metagenome TaxID=412755 RepID=A0A0F9X3Y1_9ZZZZ|nr:Ni/Fe hydrogenase subunit alpha [Candidatus Nealsonbacteria bacterium]HEB46151.1 Ni/Fe hydrogenase subunit alpha [Candidatus Nealsonbacteria bacterium]
MHDNEKIKIDYIAKIEGHASFLADIVKGEIQKARIEVEEGARLIEGILINRKIEELPEIASRICGICPTVHYLTSLKAIESALNVKISEQTLLLRKLMMTGQIMTSHSLHLFFFSCPDFLGLESGLELIKKCPVEASYSIKLRDIGNKITEIIGGRAVHPLTPTVGGFRKLPKRKDLENLKAACLKLLPEVKRLAQFFLKLDYPEFERKTDYICLADNKEYAVHNGKIEGLNTKDFLGKIKEIQISESVVKRTSYRNSYMVGALPRIKNNNQYLNSLAKKIFLESKIQNHYFNPFYNILAQAIEIVHFLEEAIKLIDNILEAGIKEEKPEFQVKDGRGIVAMEAPRGLLFYDVQVAEDGTVSDLNIITPTVQNLANLEKDLEDFENLKDWKKLNKEQKKQKIAMLIRAYDPCITCATH